MASQGEVFYIALALISMQSPVLGMVEVSVCLSVCMSVTKSTVGFMKDSALKN